jgi:redox-sensitive bicupin YhaK (pirin superfamily)
MARAALIHVPRESLFVSEPNPMYFGNEPNTPAQPGWTNQNWLKSRFHFNFAEYSGGRDHFGVLRVMNDDLVQPDRGFGEHPHRDMEIITFIIDGALTHRDSISRKPETLGRGSIQYMTSGSGVRHSEHNLVKDKSLRFIQSWIVPRARGLTPAYGSMEGTATTAEARRNRWAHLVSDANAKDVDTPVKIHQDCNMHVAELEPGAACTSLRLAEGRQAYMLVMEGSVRARAGDADVNLRQHDACEAYGVASLELEADQQGAFVLLFEMAWR